MQHGMGPPVEAEPTVQIPSLERLQHFAHFSPHWIFFNENNSVFHFYCQMKGCLHESLLLQPWIKARPQSWCNQQAGAAHGPFLAVGGWAHPAARALVQHSPASGQLLLLFTLLFDHILSILNLISNIFLFHRTYSLYLEIIFSCPHGKRDKPIV